MQIMALASQKGGVGKTTLAGHLAVQAEREGTGPVALVDADPQESLADWWNERTEDTPVFLQTSLRRLEQDVARMRDLGIELLIIDSPPAITSTIREVVRISDIVVVPTRPSPHDLRSVARTVKMVEELDKPMVFVVNGASSWARITSEAVMALSQHGTLAPVIIHQRSDFASSMIDGRTVMELSRSSPSAGEIARLWTYLDGRLNKKFRPTLLSSPRDFAIGYGTA